MKKVMSLFMAAALSAASFFSLPGYNVKASGYDTQVHFIDVGQGDSIYIKHGSYDILIDAGDNNKGQDVVNYLKPLVDGNLELVIGTHPDADHIGGLDVVLQNFKTNYIMDSGMYHTTKTYADYMREVNAQVENGATYKPDEDMRFNIGNGVYLDIIETGDENGSKNDNSVLSKLVVGDVKILLTGDMEEHTEHKILNKDLDVDVLKAGHHGSRTSSSPEFLDVVTPKATIISVAETNRYNHPHQETLDKFTDRNIDQYMTKDLGSILLTTDGSTYTINGKTYKSENDGSTTPDPKPSVADVRIDNIDARAEVATITNYSSDSVDLTGWSLLSTVGNQRFYFPDNFVLQSGESVKVVAGRNSGSGYDEIKWSGSYIWSNSYDPGELYNAEGSLMSEFGK